MTNWTDCNGKTRTLILNVGSGRKIRNKLNIDLVKSHDPTPLVELINQRERLAEVLFVLSEDTDEDAFFDAMDSKALESGWQALSESFVEFCPENSRDSVREAIQKQTDALAEASAQIAKALRDPAVDIEINRVIAESQRKAIESFTAACK